MAGGQSFHTANKTYRDTDDALSEISAAFGGLDSMSQFSGISPSVAAPPANQQPRPPVGVMPAGYYGTPTPPHALSQTHPIPTDHSRHYPTHAGPRRAPVHEYAPYHIPSCAPSNTTAPTPSWRSAAADRTEVEMDVMLMTKRVTGSTREPEETNATPLAPLLARGRHPRSVAGRGTPLEMQIGMSLSTYRELEGE
ncbi:hypothetical protein JB92DRAFT_2837882 [Gautieria morchelliformis]|nr:hypothetical protein JB92DRAFT_2837882 [Gautieria morchelliformis]